MADTPALEIDEDRPADDALSMSHGEPNSSREPPPCSPDGPPLTCYSPMASRKHWKHLSSRCRRAWTDRPEPGSLYADLQRTPRERTLCEPFYWTQRHADMLGYTFHKKRNTDKPSPKPISMEHIQDAHPNTCAPGDAKRLFLNLKAMLRPTRKGPYNRAQSRKAFGMVLADLWPHVFSSPMHDNVDVIMDGMVFPRVVQNQIMFPLTGPGNKQPKKLSSGEKNTDKPSGCTIRRSPWAHVWRPKHAVCATSQDEFRMLRRMVPSRFAKLAWTQTAKAEDAVRDPLIVCVFLGMAQRHFYASPIIQYSNRRSLCPYRPFDHSSINPPFGDVKLRIVSYETAKPGSYETGAAFITVYTATVKRGFLERFHDPFAACLTNEGRQEGLHIEYTHVSVWPVLGLRERMGRALGEDLVGPFDTGSFKDYLSKKGSDKECLESTVESEFARDLRIANMAAPSICRSWSPSAGSSDWRDPQIIGHEHIAVDPQSRKFREEHRKATAEASRATPSDAAKLKEPDQHILESAAKRQTAATLETFRRTQPTEESCRKRTHEDSFNVQMPFHLI